MCPCYNTILSKIQSQQEFDIYQKNILKQKLLADNTILQRTIAQTDADKNQMLAEKDNNLAQKDEKIKKLLALISQYQSQCASNNIQDNEVTPLSQNQAVYSQSDAEENQEQI
ncbi:hypothetical protein TTHMIC_00047 [Tetrahymena thermophila SB210]|uniref:Uncharacterized protein n=1 Tax=Tetrahymena thermophila (strain SB210) TaxID=312017 RepID=A0A1B9C288_TETTS|nr:hypothetical protein TTHMIC_00047 [Tetrahymena thermophila SB210]